MKIQRNRNREEKCTLGVERNVRSGIFGCVLILYTRVTKMVIFSHSTKLLSQESISSKILRTQF